LSVKRKKIQDALVEGATRGLSGTALYAFVREEHPDAKNKRIVEAAFYSLSDPDLTDRNILDVIYALALSRRLGEEEAGEAPAEEPAAPEPEAAPETPAPKKASRKAASSKATADKAAPAKAKPAKEEPKAKPAKAKPAKAEPAKSEPAKSEPTKAEPAKTPKKRVKAAPPAAASE
jgi:outer membrane biosynthesis protein TonB